MALSGSFDWTLTRAQVIAGALRKLGVLPSGGTPTTAQTNDGAEALNALIKAFHADGMPVWAITSSTFTVTSGTASYTIGPSSTVDVAGAPLKVLQAWRTPTGEDAIALRVENRNNFNTLSSTASGPPTTLYYQPILAVGVPSGTIKLWPTPDDSTTTITLDYQRPFSDMDATGDNLDFPSYFIQALIYNLAWVLCPEYGISPSDRGITSKEAIYWKEQALSFGSEEGSLFLQPDTGK